MYIRNMFSIVCVRDRLPSCCCRSLSAQGLKSGASSTTAARYWARVPVPALLSRVVVVNGYHGPAPSGGHTGLDGVDPVLVGDAADPAVQAVSGDPGLFMEQEQAYGVYGCLADVGHGRVAVHG